MAFTKVTGPGIHSLSQLQTHNIHSAGIITAAQFVGDGSELTGVSGFATAMSNDQYSILNDVFTTGKTDTVAAGTSVLVESNPTAGYIAFTRAENIVVAAGATLTISKVGSGTTLKTDILFNNDGANADKLDGQDGSYYTDAANITGTLPALDGSNLTNISATTATTATTAVNAQGLTGSPNIVVGVITASRFQGGVFAGDGSGLTGVTASGSGINVNNSGTIIGVAGTINFGSNLDVSAASAGIVTVTQSTTGIITASGLDLAEGVRTLDFILADAPATGNVGCQLRAGSGDYIGLAGGGGTGIGLVVDDNNNVSIGTKTSIQKFTIEDGGISLDNGWNTQWGVNASRAYIQGEDANGNNRLILGTTNLPRVEITQHGSIGFNGLSPGSSDETVAIQEPSGGAVAAATLSHLSGGNRYGCKLETISGANQGLVISGRFNSTYSEFLTIDTSGNVLIGDTEGHIGKLSTLGTGNHISASRHSTDTSAANLILAKYRGTRASPTVVADGDDLGNLSWYGYNGSSIIKAADVTARTNGTVDSTNMTTDLVFSTTSGNVNTEKFRINAAGNVGINTTAPTSKFDVHMSEKSGINFTNSGNNSILDFRSNQVESCGRIRIDESSGGGYMDFYTKTTGGTITKRLSIDTNGLIGTNNRDPSAYGSPNLLISGTDSTLTLMGDGSTNSTSYTGIKFRVAGASTGDYTKAGIFSRREGGYNDLSLIFALNTDANANSVAIADEKMRIRSNGYVDITGASDLRLTLGSQGTAGTNDSNWVRGSANNLMFNCADTSGEHIFEVAGTATAKINPGVGVRAENTCKAWVCYKHDGGVSAIHDDFYVTSVTDEGTGIFSIDFDGDMGTEDAIAYQVGSHSQTPVTVGGIAYTPSYGSQNPWWSMEDDWCRINLQKVSDSGNTYTDSEWWNLIAFGDAI